MCIGSSMLFNCWLIVDSIFESGHGPAATKYSAVVLITLHLGEVPAGSVGRLVGKEGSKMW